MTPIRSGATLLFCLVCVLIPLLVVSVLPFIDLYDHVGRYFILSRLDENAFLARHYDSNWRVLPNLGMDVIGTALLAVVGPLLGAKLLVGLVLAAQVTGVGFLARSLGSWSMATAVLVAATVAYSFILTWGFINFLLATALSLWAVGAWIRLRDRPLVAALMAIVAGLCIFLTHGFAFALYGVFIAAAEFGFWLSEAAPRRKLLANLSVLAVSAIAPATLFLLSATAGRSAGASTSASIARYVAQGSLSDRLAEEAVYRGKTILLLAESGWRTADAVLLLATAAVLGIALWRGTLAIDRRFRFGLLALTILAIVTPPALFGVGFVSDRLPLTLALFGAASLRPGSREGRGPATPHLALALILIARTAVLVLAWLPYNEDERDYRALMRAVPPRSITQLLIVPERSSRERRFARRCEMWGPLTVPLFGAATSLFSDADAQPLLVRGALASAMATARKPLSGNDSPPGMVRMRLREIADERKVDYVLACGDGRTLAAVDANGHQRGNLMLLKVR